MIAEEVTQPVRLIDLGDATPMNYRKSRNIAKNVYANASAADKDVISGMVSDCEYVIEWLSTGKMPGNRRGIERRAAYQREKLMDPLRMQAYVQGNTAGSPSNISEGQRFRIEEALRRLSDRERECYVMAHGQCFSFSYIADLLKISKGSVENYVKRAQAKISQDLEDNLFLM
jgi:RNA polymerase sigma factor (sigma-70 family)